MAEALVALFISACILLINYFISRDFFYPATLYSIIWFIVILCYVIFILFHPTTIYLFEIKTLFCFILGQVLFSIGGLFGNNKQIESKNLHQENTILYNVDKIVIFFLLAILPIYINKLMTIVNSSKLSKLNFYVVLRYEFVSNGVTIGILDYLNPLCVFAFCFSLYRFNFLSKNVKKDIQFNLYKILVYLLAFTYAFLTTGRTYFVMMFSVYIGYKIVSQSFKRIHFILAFLGFLIVFIGNALILGKGANADASLADNATSILDNITLYFLGGPYGFDNLMRSDFVLEYGENIFRFFISVAYAFKLIALAPKDLVMGYVTTPVLTNVYTVYFNYTKDFGWLGLLFFSLWGYIHTYLYYKRKSGFLYLYCYALMLYPLIMSFFQDQYLSLLSTWVQLIFYGFIASKFIVSKTNINAS